MGLLDSIHGTSALLLFCGLILAEESGIPLPLVPGDALLIVAGLLIAGSELDPFAFYPCAAICAVAGGVLGFAWSRAIGLPALRVLAVRLRAERAFDQAVLRLQAAGSIAIFVARMIPGMRVNTTLVAGAARVPFRVFMLGLLPSIAVWLAGFTLLGVAVGAPALHYLHRAERLGLQGALLVGVGGVAFLALRHIPAPAARMNALRWAPRSWRIVLGIALDLSLVGTVASGATVVIRDDLGFADPDGLAAFAVLLSVLFVMYVWSSRRGIGGTPGERATSVSYRRPREPPA